MGAATGAFMITGNFTSNARTLASSRDRMKVSVASSTCHETYFAPVPAVIYPYCFSSLFSPETESSKTKKVEEETVGVASKEEKSVEKKPKKKTIKKKVKTTKPEKEENKEKPKKESKKEEVKENPKEENKK